MDYDNTSIARRIRTKQMNHDSVRFKFDNFVKVKLNQISTTFRLKPKNISSVLDRMEIGLHYKTSS